MVTTPSEVKVLKHALIRQCGARNILCFFGDAQYAAPILMVEYINTPFIRNCRRQAEKCFPRSNENDTVSSIAKQKTDAQCCQGVHLFLHFISQGTYESWLEGPVFDVKWPEGQRKTGKMPTHSSVRFERTVKLRLDDSFL
jgi:hypothetical protein